MRLSSASSFLDNAFSFVLNYVIHNLSIISRRIKNAAFWREFLLFQRGSAISIFEIFVLLYKLTSWLLRVINKIVPSCLLVK